MTEFGCWRAAGRAALVVIAVAAGASCGDEGPPPPPSAQVAQLGGGVVASVGQQELEAVSVAAIADRQGISLSQARDAAVRDALFASGARQRLPPRDVLASERRVLARAVLRQLTVAAAGEPISDEELARASAERWLQVARPRGFRSVHALVKVDPKASESNREQARALAQRLHDALEPVAAEVTRLAAPDYPEERTFDGGYVATIDKAGALFSARAQTVPKGAQQVVIQPLQVVAADGRVLDRNIPPPGSSYDPAFSAAISALSQRGALSAVVETPFGFHVILLLEIIEGRSLDRAGRIRELHPLIVRQRGVRLHQQMLAAAASERGVEIMTNADALLALVNPS